MAQKKPWSLLSSQGLVLVTLCRHRGVTINEVTAKCGLSRGTVFRALRDLQDAGMLEVHHSGRRSFYQVRPDVSFRHPELQDRGIGELLKVFPPRSD